jgi:hypothetical protein
MNTPPPLNLSLPLPINQPTAAVRSRTGDAGSVPPTPHDPSGEGWHGHPLFSLDNLYRAYRQCRRRKRRTHNALLFERHLEANLLDLHQELNAGTYRPRRSIAFLFNRPKRREVFAASFRDRVVHHVLVSEDRAELLAWEARIAAFLDVRSASGWMPIGLILRTPRVTACGRVRWFAFPGSGAILRLPRPARAPRPRCSRDTKGRAGHRRCAGR